MTGRKYWAVGSTFGGTDDMTKEFLSKGIWYDGYADDGNKKDDDTLNRINVGDCLIMKSSSTKGPGHSISFTKVKSIGIIIEKEDYYSFKVNWYATPELPIDFDSIWYSRTVEEMRDDDILEYVMDKIKSEEMKAYLKEILTILEKKTQIILQGPPGTGKTYTAQDVAYYIIFGTELNHDKERRKIQLLELENHDCYEFVQFHPSYTYEDFVRGITAKPNPNGTGIIYEAEDKLLGLFALNAEKNLSDSKKSIEAISLEQWLWKKIEEFHIKIDEDLDKNGDKIEISKKAYINETDANGVRYTGDAWSAEYVVPYSDLVNMAIAKITTQKEILVLNSLTKTAKRRPLYWLKIFEQFKYFLDNHIELPPTFDVVKEKKFVLIIDEINRANLPSVLGELIYALEYRDHAVQSMYELENGGNSLILPSNLYIIGTMNTADRSVGHIDYAIRRRFAFINVLPNSDVITFQLAKDYFDGIKKFVTDHHASDFEVDDIMLGHSYFLSENNSDLKIKLRYEVYPILKEYIKDGILNKNETSVEELKSLLKKIENIND